MCALLTNLYAKIECKANSRDCEARANVSYKPELSKVKRRLTDWLTTNERQLFPRVTSTNSFATVVTMKELEAVILNVKYRQESYHRTQLVNIMEAMYSNRDHPRVVYLVKVEKRYKTATLSTGRPISRSQQLKVLHSPSSIK